MYDLSESERHPILQAEALREKDKEIARLRLQIASLGGPTVARFDDSSNEGDPKKRRKSSSLPRKSKKTALPRQKPSTKDGSRGKVERPVESPTTDVTNGVGSLRIFYLKDPLTRQ